LLAASVNQRLYTLNSVRKRTVFIVEDETVLHDLYKMILETNGFEVIGTAVNGQEAVDKYKSYMEAGSRPDLVIMDHRMPVKDGITATREIKELDEKANILFASADIFIAKKALETGILGFLPKPFTMKRLITTIREKIENK